MLAHVSVIPFAVSVANERAFGARPKWLNSIWLAKFLPMDDRIE